MQQKNKTENFFGDIQSKLEEMMTGLPSYPVDMKKVMETNRRNFQAMTEANQRVIQGWQMLAQRQGEMVSEFLQNNAAASPAGFASASTEEKIALQTEAFKTVYQRSIENTRELAELAGKCTKDTAEVISQRVMASMNEISAANKKAD